MAAVRESWRPVLRAIVGELASCVPADWSTTSLTVRYEEDRMTCELSDGTQRRHAAPTPWLVTLVHDLHAKMARGGCGWISARIRLVFFIADTDVDLAVDASLREQALPVPSENGSHWSVDLAFARAAVC